MKTVESIIRCNRNATMNNVSEPASCVWAANVTPKAQCSQSVADSAQA